MAKPFMWSVYIALMERCTELSIRKDWLKSNSPKLEDMVSQLLQEYARLRRNLELDANQKKNVRKVLRHILDILARFSNEPRFYENIFSGLEKKSALQFLSDDFPKFSEVLQYSKAAIEIDEYIKQWKITRNHNSYDDWSFGWSCVECYPSSHFWWRDAVDNCTINGLRVAKAKVKAVKEGERVTPWCVQNENVDVEAEYSLELILDQIGDF